jgi:hypothetical protein
MAKPKIDDPKFGPLLRAVCNILKPDATDRVTLGLDARAMVAFHRRYEADPQAFAHNPAGKLFGYIQKNGGVAGLAATVIDSADEHDKSDKPDPQPKPDPNRDPHFPDIGPIAVAEFAKQSEGIGIAQLEIDVRANDSEPFAALLRKHKGQIIVLGHTVEADEIAATASAVARESLPFLPPALRALVETIKTQMFPSCALPSNAEARLKWLQTKFGDPSDLQEAD